MSDFKTQYFLVFHISGVNILPLSEVRSAKMPFSGDSSVSELTHVYSLYYVYVHEFAIVFFEQDTTVGAGRVR